MPYTFVRPRTRNTRSRSVPICGCRSSAVINADCLGKWSLTSACLYAILLSSHGQGEHLLAGVESFARLTDVDASAASHDLLLNDIALCVVVAWGLAVLAKLARQPLILAYLAA